MKFLTNEKLTIVGAGGAIGSNMAQTALMLGLTQHLRHVIVRFSQEDDILRRIQDHDQRNGYGKAGRLIQIGGVCIFHSKHCLLALTTNRRMQG